MSIYTGGRDQTKRASLVILSGNIYLSADVELEW